MEDNDGTGAIADDQFTKNVREVFDLLRPTYEKAVSYGHVGVEELEFTW